MGAGSGFVLTGYHQVGENDTMDAIIKTPLEDPDALAVIEHAMQGKPLDPEIYRRIREAGDRLTEEIRKEHGTVDLAVDLIRDARK